MATVKDKEVLDVPEEKKEEIKKEPEVKLIESEKDNNYVRVSDEDKLLRQIDNEYRLAKKFYDPIFNTNIKRLKLYNNQKKDPKAIGDPLLFTIMSTLHAATYDDRMTVEWLPIETGDVETAEHLNMLSQYDYSAMNKNVLDYDVLWDMFFFSYGITELVSFDREKMIPVPKLLDPLTFLYDPQGSQFEPGDEQMRFFGSEVLLTKSQMKEAGVYRHISEVKEGAEKKDLVNQARYARQELSGGQSNDSNSEDSLGDNDLFKVLQWRTNFDGMKLRVELSNGMKLINRIQEVKHDNWGITVKKCWPIAHQFRGVSVPDLTEDKQRKRSIIQNLGVKALQSQVYPRFVYDPDKIKNKADLKFGLNKHIPATGGVSGALEPVKKDSPDMNFYSYMMDLMDSAAQRATATPEIQQGTVSKEQRTLGELNLVAQRVDTRYSLIVKNVMNGEKDFWRQWYKLYKMYFKGKISKKVIRLAGLKGGEFRNLTRENIITTHDPDIEIQSKILNDASNIRKLSQFAQVLQVSGADPTTDRRYGIKHFAELAGMTTDEIDDLLPQTIDEMIAENQNKALNQNKLVPVLNTDNHIVHIKMHCKANATKEAVAHIETHKKALLMQQQNPDLIPLGPQMAEEEQGTQPGNEGVVSPGSAQGSQQVSPSNSAKLSQGQGFEQIRT